MGSGSALWAASPPQCAELVQTLQPLFAQNFSDLGPTGYQRGACSQNSKNLSLRWQAAGLDVAHAWIVQVSNPYGKVKGFYARGGSPDWEFHVFLMIDGLVYDQDYTGQPTPIGIEPYLASFFDSYEVTTYRYQIKPASVYGGSDIWGLKERDSKPMSYSEFRNWFQPTACRAF